MEHSDRPVIAFSWLVARAERGRSDRIVCTSVAVPAHVLVLVVVG